MKLVIGMAALAAVVATPMAQADVVINLFDVAGSVSASGGSTATSSVDDSGILGGQRDLYVAPDSGHTLSLVVDADGNGLAIEEQGPNPFGGNVATIVWDGVDGSGTDGASVDTSGLSSFDLTEGAIGNDRFLITTTGFLDAGEISIQVWSNGGIETDILDRRYRD